MEKMEAGRKTTVLKGTRNEPLRKQRKRRRNKAKGALPVEEEAVRFSFRGSLTWRRKLIQTVLF